MKQIIIEPKTESDLKAVKSILKNLHIPFKEKAETKTLKGIEKSPYDPAFVKKILQGDKEVKEGKLFKVKKFSDLWK